MRKFVFITLLFGASTGGLAASAFADNGSGDGNCAPDCREWSFCDGKFKIGGEWRLNQVKEDGLYIGSLNTMGTVPTNLVEIIQPNNIHSFGDRTSGYRAYAAYEFPCCAWELGAIYTYTQANAQTGKVVPGAGQTLTSFYTQGSSNPLSLLQGKWNSNLNQLDIDFSRGLIFGKCFGMRPHIGVRVAWGDQNYHVNAQFVAPLVVASSMPFFLPIGTANVADHLRQKFHGCGIEGRLDSTWDVGYGLSIVGYFGGSVLYSRIDVDNRQLASSVPIMPSDDVSTAPALLSENLDKDRLYTAIPTVEYFVGLEYEAEFCEFEIAAYVGWEQQVYFNLNHFTTYVSKGFGNYSVSSVIVGAEVGF